MLEDSVDLLTGDAGEPGEEVIHAGTGFEVLEERLDRYTRALEDPRAANFARNPLHGTAP